MNDYRPWPQSRYTLAQDFLPRPEQKLEHKVKLPLGTLKIDAKPPKQVGASLVLNLDPPRVSPGPHRHGGHGVPGGPWRNQGTLWPAAPVTPPPRVMPQLAVPRVPPPPGFQSTPNGLRAGASPIRPPQYVRPAVFPVPNPRTLHDHARNADVLIRAAAAALAAASPTPGFSLGRWPPPTPPTIIRR